MNRSLVLLEVNEGGMGETNEKAEYAHVNKYGTRTRTGTGWKRTDALFAVVHNVCPSLGNYYLFSLFLSFFGCLYFSCTIYISLSFRFPKASLDVYRVGNVSI